MKLAGSGFGRLGSGSRAGRRIDSDRSVRGRDPRQLKQGTHPARRRRVRQGRSWNRPGEPRPPATNARPSTADLLDGQAADPGLQWRAQRLGVYAVVDLLKRILVPGRHAEAPARPRFHPSPGPVPGKQAVRDRVEPRLGRARPLAAKATQRHNACANVSQSARRRPPSPRSRHATTEADGKLDDRRRRRRRRGHGELAPVAPHR